jgi:hypothetical protein
MIYPVSARMEWNKTFGRTNYDLGTGIKVAQDGGYIFVGIKDAVFYDDGGDCWLVKLDANGAIQWEKTFGGADSEIASDVCVTNDHGYAIAFSTRSFGVGDMDICVVKTDGNGTELWNRTYGGVSHDQATSIQQTTDDGYIITAMTQSFGDNEAWLFKVDQDGGLQWNHTYGTYDDTGEYFMQALQTSDGGYVAAGRNYLADGLNSDIFVVKIDEEGTVEWEKQLGGPYPDGCIAVTQTIDGCYILTGQSSQSAHTPEDISLFKIDSLGNEIWSRYYGSPYFDTGTSVLQCADGGFLVAGEYSRTSQNTDAIILRTDAEGYEEWTQIFGGTQSDGFLEIQQTSDDGAIVVGFTESFGAGDSDIWVMKFSAFENRPPSPPTIIGPTKGKINVEVTYNFSTADPEGDQVYYYIDWGDGTNSSWIGPYSSGVTIPQSHTWSKKGTYIIKAKAKDVRGYESGWGQLSITMPFSYNIPLQFFWDRFFQRFPLAFPILRYMMGYQIPF